MKCCQRLQEAPGFGPVMSSVVKHWMGDARQFRCSCDASAALGLVPRQHTVRAAGIA
ncbi:MAG: transposase [Parahaliea sp.]